ncbi:RteC domain-containing protein [Capnocytophaga canis]|uniref:RteC domain-containing protein n=1 Tax=Capnocytophaga canis TaxID=1848903 RepID=UPI00370D4011
MEKPEKIGVTYLSYKDFINNYGNDFKEWQKHYPDGVEVDYLDFLEDSLCYHMYSNRDNIFPFSEYIKINSTEIHYSDFIFEIERCIDVYSEEVKPFKNIEEIKDTLDGGKYILGNYVVQKILDKGLYGIPYETFKYYIPFLEISDIYEDRYTIFFDDKKYKNFEISARRVLEFIEARREQLKNQPVPNFWEAQPAPVVSEEPQNQNIKPLQWKGEVIELAELVQALIESKLLNPELTQKEIYSRFKAFFEIDFDHEDKKKKMKNRTTTLTPFLEKLMISVENFITGKD